jgi:hypothetical protein
MEWWAELRQTMVELAHDLPRASLLWILGVGGSLVGLVQLCGLIPDVLTWREWLLFVAAALFISVFQLYHRERKAKDALEERLRPKLKATFSADDPGCVRPNTKINAEVNSPEGTQKIKIPATYYRIRVETDNSSLVEGCFGRLLAIKRDGKVVVSGENIDLPFAHSTNDAFSKRIYEGVPEYLDLVALPQGLTPAIATLNFIAPSSLGQKIFTLPGRYTFEVVLLSPSGDAVRVAPVLNWTGNPETSGMS